MVSDRANKYCTIYLLTNKTNNKIYVGQTWYNLNIRSGKVGENYANSVKLYNAIKYYGWSNFEYKKLTICNTQNEADEAESFFIRLYNSDNQYMGYNLETGGSHGRHSEETKKKISNAMKGKSLSDETRAKISAIHTGLKKPKHTDEWKAQNSKFIKRRHKENGHPMQGRHHTIEAKAKISAASKGRKMDPESVRKGAIKRMIPKDKELAILKEYKSGTSIKIIANNNEVGSSTVRRVLARNGVVRK